MSTRSAPVRVSRPGLVQVVGLVVGLGVTASSMSSGFIWASQGKVALVYVAGFFSWTGYAFAHYAVVGEFVDDVSEEEEEEEEEEEKEKEEDTAKEGRTPEEGEPTGGALRATLADIRAIVPSEPHRAIGFLAGIAILVAGIAILAWYVRQENHLLGNLGSGMFLGGYVVAHYFDAGKLL